MHHKGPALVLAGPGSGKTTVLVERVRFLIEEKGTRPDKILVVTFAKAAASQMRERFLKRTNDKYDSVTFSTIHSVCYSILNSESSFGSYSLLSENEKTNVISEAIKEYFIRFPDKIMMPGTLKDVLTEISSHKVRCCDPVLFKFCYERLKEYKIKNRCFDFDDMAEMTDKMLSSEGINNNTTNRYEYVLVDEFQDTGADQFGFLRKLCADDNFYAVGDEDQSIYGFRGACPEIMLNFKEFFKNCVIYSLPENFRSDKKIVDIANKIISKNKKRYNKKIIPTICTCNDKAVKMLSAQDEKDELELLITEIKESLKSPGSMAVLARTRNIMEKVAGKLIENNINFHVRERVKNIFEIPVIMTVMSFFKVASGELATDDLIRIFRASGIAVNSVFFNTDDISWTKISTFFKGSEKIKDFEFKVKNLVSFAPSVALDFIRNVIGLDKISNTFEKSRLDEFRSLIKDIQNIYGVLEFEKNYKESFSDTECDAPLTLLTIHSAKGLEFDRICIPYMNEGSIPSSKAVSEKDIEEERRIFYVALTRAKKEIILSMHESLRGKKAIPSRFWKEIKCLDNF